MSTLTLKPFRDLPCLTLLLVALTSLGSPIARAEWPSNKPVTMTNEFKMNGKTYKIVGRARQGGSARSFERIWIEYSVYEGKKFIHPTRGGGGTLFGCSPTWPVSLPNDFIAPLKVGDRQLGWLLKTGGICGNTYSAKYQLVVPPLSPTASEQTYDWKEFVSKFDPILREQNKKVEIWYAYQEWGKSGTAGSFLPGFDSNPPKLSPDFKTWPKMDDMANGFPSLFVAGMVDDNPDVMEAATKQFFDEKAKENYEWAGLPSTRKAAEDAIDGMRKLQPYLHTFVRNK